MRQVKLWKVQKFAGDVVYDLRSRNLLLPVIGLLIALVAVPVLIAKGGSERRCRPVRIRHDVLAELPGDGERRRRVQPGRSQLQEAARPPGSEGPVHAAVHGRSRFLRARPTPTRSRRRSVVRRPAAPPGSEAAARGGSNGGGGGGGATRRARSAQQKTTYFWWRVRRAGRRDRPGTGDDEERQALHLPPEPRAAGAHLPRHRGRRKPGRLPGLQGRGQHRRPGDLLPEPWTPASCSASTPARART